MGPLWRLSFRMGTQGSRLLVTSGRHLNIGLRGTALASTLLISMLACVRDPLPSVCPQLAAGDLVVTEIRGAQTGSYREWIEIYNATDAPVPVAGLRITLTRLDGDGTQSFVVRDETLELAPGGYLVLGGGDPAEFDYIDYDYTPDLHSSSLYGGATLELKACATVVDKLVYLGLPDEGTLAFGAVAPAAADNDDTTVGWCTDDHISDGPQTEIGLRGTPGAANPPCP